MVASAQMALALCPETGRDSPLDLPVAEHLDPAVKEEENRRHRDVEQGRRRDLTALSTRIRLHSLHTSFTCTRLGGGRTGRKLSGPPRPGGGRTDGERDARMLRASPDVLRRSAEDGAGAVFEGSEGRAPPGRCDGLRDGPARGPPPSLSLGPCDDILPSVAKPLRWWCWHEAAPK